MLKPTAPKPALKPAQKKRTSRPQDTMVAIPTDVRALLDLLVAAYPRRYKNRSHLLVKTALPLIRREQAAIRKNGGTVPTWIFEKDSK